MQDPVADRLEEVDPFQDLGLRLGPEPLEAGDPARLAGLAEVGQALDFQVVVEQLDLLRPEPGDAEQRDEAGGRRPLQFLEGGQLPGGRELGDLGQHRRPDPGDLGEAAVGDHPREV